MSASPRSLTTTAAVLHSIIYSENSALVPVAGLLRSRNKTCASFVAVTDCHQPTPAHRVRDG
jgi:hypothetical protein